MLTYRQRIGNVGFALLFMAGPALAQSALDRRAMEELRVAKQQALDADLRADWNGLFDVRQRFEILAGQQEVSAVAQYFLGYVDWRMSSLAYIVLGPPGLVVPLERAVQALSRAVALEPSFADAQALLATCAGILLNADSTRRDTLIPVIKTAWPIALERGEDNPRVQLLRAMTEFFVPPERGGDREGGLERWKRAIRLLEEDGGRPRDPRMPDWGHAEAWAWLGGAYLTLGQPREAADALERAVALRPDFWWAAKAALPFAKRPLPAN